MNNYIRIVAAIGAVGLFIAASFILWQGGLPQPIELSIAPTFEVATLDNQQFQLNEELNRPVVLNFWATWCVPCIIEMPRLEQAYQDYTDDNLLIVGINAGENPDLVRQWVAENNINFPIVIDSNQNLETAYEIRGFPTTFFIDRQGQIQRVVRGIVSEGELENGLSLIGIAP